jgi:hypothetical protein
MNIAFSHHVKPSREELNTKQAKKTSTERMGEIFSELTIWF